MGTHSQDIRGALQTQLGTVPGIPARAYEGVKYKPQRGTPFVEATVVPGSRRQRTMGTNHLNLNDGTFEVVLVYPAGEGTGAIEAMADAVMAAFKTSAPITVDDTTVNISYAEPRTIQEDADWIRKPVSIGWFLHEVEN